MTARSKTGSEKKVFFALCGALAVFVLSVYLQTSSFNFTNFDDNIYVFQNEHVTQGLSWRSTIWAFTSTHASNWHPVTWLSHMLDCHLFGLDAGAHHLSSVVLHLANSILLFVVLRAMTGRQGLSWFVAALFAVHPLHVESVAWIAERKDVLSSFFGILMLLAYWKYTRRHSNLYYSLVMVAFILGLLSKPMLVSLPILLLLLDYWPLGRLGCPSGSHGVASFKTVLVEKIPLFVLALASSVVTFLVQRASGAVKPLDAFPFCVRVANAVWAYCIYILKTFWPTGLACFYPHPGTGIPTWQVVLSATALTVVTAVAIIKRRQTPYVFTGWLWYIAALLPVIGLVQVGKQAMADRYTYLPHVGLFVAVVWGCDRLVQLASVRLRLGLLQALWASAACAAIVLLSVAAHKQVGYWRNDVSLWKRAIAVTKNNAVAYYNLGTTLATQGDAESAMACFKSAVRIDPRKHEAYANLGALLGERGDYEAAVKYLAKAVKLRPRNPIYRANLGIALVRMGRGAEAIPHLRYALRIQPHDENCRQALVEAVEQLRR
ncbi:MAG: tetratricopeptide repeat protein [Armatimonadota bacterium]|nr:tetratricopeptide repeat protein [Armatimonadota bacterium]